MSQIVYPNGDATIVVPAGGSIAVASRAEAQVYLRVGFPNYPEQDDLIGLVSNLVPSVFGPYANGATIEIQAGATEVLYSVGTAPVIAELGDWAYQGAPAAITTAAASTTLTAAQVLTGIIVGDNTSGGNIDFQMPTVANLIAATDWAVNESFDFSLVNVSAGAVPITIVTNTTWTLVGDMAASATIRSARFRARVTGATTGTLYRIA
jgi:hypothetical protein